MRSGKWWDRDSWPLDAASISPLEHQLTMHLERAHLLAERAQQSNDAVQRLIDRAQQLAAHLVSAVRKKSQ